MMMSMKVWRHLVFILLAVTSLAQATQNDFDLGIILGDPTGISAKKWLTGGQALDFAAGWKTGQVDEFTLHADYLLHDYTILKDQQQAMVLYYGVGVRSHDRDNQRRRNGLRLPVGVEMTLGSSPLVMFAEIVPRLDLSPDTDFTIDAALGFRYRFGAGKPRASSK